MCQWGLGALWRSLPGSTKCHSRAGLLPCAQHNAKGESQLREGDLGSLGMERHGRAKFEKGVGRDGSTVWAAVESPQMDLHSASDNRTFGPKGTTISRV